LTTPYNDGFFTSNYVFFFNQSGGSVGAFCQKEEDIFYDIYNNRGNSGVPRSSHPKWLQDQYSLSSFNAYKYAYNSQSVTTAFLNTDYYLNRLTDLIVKKDPIETISMTYQLQFLSKKNYIIVGPALTQYSPYMVNRSLLTLSQRNLHIYRSTEYYREGESKTKGVKTSTAFTGIVTTEAFSVTDGFPLINTESLSGYNSWAIGDNNGNLYLAVNRNANNFLPNQIYVQFKNTL
jgi:hypothetical protein